MKTTIMYEVQLSVNDEVYFGYIVFEDLTKANEFYDSILTGCFMKGSNDIHNFTHEPTAQLLETICDEEDIAVAQRVLREDILGDEETDSHSATPLPVIQFDRIGYYDQEANPSFGLTL